MEKNTFLIYNDIIYGLYACSTLDELRENFLLPLKMLIPFSYASILLVDENASAEQIGLHHPLCTPESFTDAENEYIHHADKDDLLWLIHSKESMLIKESDLLEDEKRLNSPLYLHCYRKYGIYDSLQYSIVYKQKFLGILTLFRTKADGAFTSSDMFYLRSIGVHLNASLAHLIEQVREDKHADHSLSMQQLQQDFELTPREIQILELIFQFQTNEEIADTLQIQENTIQKHMQNIFRKMDVSSRWELLKFK